MHVTITQKNIAGAVILYNSSVETINNIKTYIDQVEVFYVIDNSIYQNNELISLLEENLKVRYYWLKGNEGIATALNWAARAAIRDGFDILLTMDDDTCTPYDMVPRMILFWNQYPSPIGILSGVHHDKPATEPYRQLLYTLTSGNLLNLSAYSKIGGFRDDFFIDHVDHEYCFRLNDAGYQVVELPEIHLKHKLGYSRQIKVGPIFLRRYGTNSPTRLYYYARNGLYLSRAYFYKYPDFAWMFVKEMTRRWIKTLFLDKEKIKRVKELFNGTVDGWYGRLGKHR